jgi:deoxyribodipyrimidine photo-lyase
MENTIENKNKFKNGLFIFRRDLRIIDNKGLYLANTICNHIYPIFIFTPQQVTGQNQYKSNNAVQFMIESLQDLNKQCNNKLLTFYGNNETIIKQLITTLEIDCIIFNADYSPYAINRELTIIQLCDKLCVSVRYANDYYLHEPGSILNGQGKPYQKFTPYYNVAHKKLVDAPLGKRIIHFASTSKHLENTITIESAFKRFTKENPNILVHGGRENALKQIKVAAKNIIHYSATRDTLSKPTSQLSAYIKFGCISIREVYKTFKSNSAFIRQLYWRDFYCQILFNFPHVLGHSLNPKYDKIKWHHNEQWFNAWKTGTTGIPIVDASQRQMLQTGWTHNRGRMISSNILIKILLIDWRKGEQFYAQHLVDYDPANNNGGWQWSSGGGSDSQPFFRYFNPFIQAKEHDPECEYIKTWIPELKDVDNKIILNWDTEWQNNRIIKYPKPICDYKEQKEKSIAMYRQALY